MCGGPESEDGESPHFLCSACFSGHVLFESQKDLHDLQKRNGQVRGCLCRLLQTTCTVSHCKNTHQAMFRFAPLHRYSALHPAVSMAVTLQRRSQSCRLHHIAKHRWCFGCFWQPRSVSSRPVSSLNWTRSTSSGWTESAGLIRQKLFVPRSWL